MHTWVTLLSHTEENKRLCLHVKVIGWAAFSNQSGERAVD